MIGAKRHELPISGNSLGPGMSVYGRARARSLSLRISAAGTSLGSMLIADENAVRLASEWAAVRIPMVDEQNFRSGRKVLFALLTDPLPRWLLEDGRTAEPKRARAYKREGNKQKQ